MATPPIMATTKDRFNVSFNPIYPKIKPPVTKAKMSLVADAVVLMKTLPGKYWS